MSALSLAIVLRRVETDIAISDEFLGSSGSERVKMCVRLAAEAEEIAATSVDPEARKAYLDLKRQWNELAKEIEATARFSGA